MSNKSTYTSARDHLKIDGRGSLWPDTEDNRKAGKTVKLQIDDGDAKRYGNALKRVSNTKPASAPETK